MLYFSKIKIITVLLITLILSYLTLSNLFKFDDNLIKNKINLGLDLQGGSYLLLEIDNQPIISQMLQNKLIDLKNPLLINPSKLETFPLKIIKFILKVILFLQIK